VKWSPDPTSKHLGHKTWQFVLRRAQRCLGNVSSKTAVRASRARPKASYITAQKNLGLDEETFKKGLSRYKFKHIISKNPGRDNLQRYHRIRKFPESSEDKDNLLQQLKDKGKYSENIARGDILELYKKHLEGKTKGHAQKRSQLQAIKNALILKANTLEHWYDQIDTFSLIQLSTPSAVIENSVVL